jgi:hypothetical protein
LKNRGIICIGKGGIVTDRIKSCTIEDDLALAGHLSIDVTVHVHGRTVRLVLLYDTERPGHRRGSG